ncbi:hypothetical protein [Chryseobacterium indoltheticum]|uniref:hypothetical protein n=1 Tax=Chryseobacterium indoltheticum TaxID=254 RepID=UPI003F49AA80
MKKNNFLAITVFLLSSQQSCKKQGEIDKNQQHVKTQINGTAKNVAVVENKTPNKPEDFVPNGFRVFEKN